LDEIASLTFAGIVSDFYMKHETLSQQTKELNINQVIRINMSDLKATREKTPSEFTQLGGRGLISHVIYSEIPLVAIR
jgi:purine-nucleoside phosphorylase